MSGGESSFSGAVTARQSADEKRDLFGGETSETSPVVVTSITLGGADMVFMRCPPATTRALFLPFFPVARVRSVCARPSSQRQICVVCLLDCRSRI